MKRGAGKGVIGSAEKVKIGSFHINPTRNHDNCDMQGKETRIEGEIDLDLETKVQTLEKRGSEEEKGERENQKFVDGGHGGVGLELVPNFNV